MATIEDNIWDMARMAQKLKRETHLNEQTIMRIIDMNLALAQQRGNQVPPMPQQEYPEPEALFTPEELEAMQQELDNAVVEPSIEGRTIEETNE